MSLVDQARQTGCYYHRHSKLSNCMNSTAMEINKYPYLVDLELADDFSDNSGKIDLLIGSDFY